MRISPDPTTALMTVDKLLDIIQKRLMAMATPVASRWVM